MKLTNKTLITTLVLGVSALASQANAATLFWDGTTPTADSASQGGSGTWNNLSTANWDNGSSVQWDNTANALDTALFGGTVGTVTLGSDITVKQLGFATANYVIEPGAGPYTITLGAAGDGTTNNATLQNIYGNFGKTINANINNAGFLFVIGNGTTNLSGVISGSGGLRKVNGGTLTLSNSNTYTGQTSIGAVNTGASTVNASSFNSVNGGSPLMASSSFGAPTTIANGTIIFGDTGKQAGATINYTGTGETTDRVINFAMNGSGAGKTINNVGDGVTTGLLKFTSTATKSGSNNNDITLTGSGDGEFVGGLNFTFRTLTKNGAGTWVLGAASGNTGDTNVGSQTATDVVAGKLILSGGNPNINSNDVIRVRNSATLGGSGIFGGDIRVEQNAILAPGNSAGQMTVLNSLDLGFNSDTTTTAMELGGTTLGTDYDNITMDGTTATALTYGGNLTVVNLGLYEMDASTFVYDLFTLNTVTPTGSFATVTVNSIALTNDGFGVWTGVNGDASYEFDQADGDLVINVIPEPGSLALLGLGGLLIAGRRRRA